MHAMAQPASTSGKLGGVGGTVSHTRHCFQTAAGHATVHVHGDGSVKSANCVIGLNAPNAVHSWELPLKSLHTRAQRSARTHTRGAHSQTRQHRGDAQRLKRRQIREGIAGNQRQIVVGKVTGARARARKQPNERHTAKRVVVSRHITRAYRNAS